MTVYKKPPSPAIDWAVEILLSECGLRGSINVLNLGCGTGRNLHHLAKMGHNVWGLDISATSIEAAKLRFSSEPTPGDFEFICYDQVNELPYDSCHFDLVISIFAYNEIRDKSLRLKCLKEIERILRRPGYLLLMVPDSGNTASLTVTERYNDELKSYVAFSLHDLINECHPPLRLTNYVSKQKKTGGEVGLDHLSLWRVDE